MNVVSARNGSLVLEILKHPELALGFDRRPEEGRGPTVAAVSVSCIASAALGAALFGLALGSFGRNEAQMAASAIKMPLLLLGTTAICLPAFHVFQVLLSARPATIGQSLSLHAMAASTMAVLWGSLAPPLSFLVSTSFDYRLSQMLAVAIAALGGFIGLRRLARGYRALCDPSGGQRGRLFVGGYLVLFGAVGLQLSWILRPFLGSPSLPFQIFRELEGSIYSHLLSLVTGR